MTNKKVDKKHEAYSSKGSKPAQGKPEATYDVGQRELKPTKGKKQEMGKKAEDQASAEVASMSTGRAMGKSGKGKSSEAAKAESGTQFSKPQGSDYRNPAKANKNDRY